MLFASRSHNFPFEIVTVAKLLVVTYLLVVTTSTIAENVAVGALPPTPDRFQFFQDQLAVLQKPELAWLFWVRYAHFLSTVFSGFLLAVLFWKEVRASWYLVVGSFVITTILLIVSISDGLDVLLSLLCTLVLIRLCWLPGVRNRFRIHKRAVALGLISLSVVGIIVYTIGVDVLISVLPYLLN